MRRVFFIIGAVWLSVQDLKAQTRQIMTLQQCIDIAIKNSIEVQQRSLQTDAAGINKAQTKLNMLPSLNGDVFHGVNQGRSIDPFTNNYINQTVNYANFGLSSDLILFNGLNLRNQVKQATSSESAVKAEWQQSKDDVTLNVIWLICVY